MRQNECKVEKEDHIRFQDKLGKFFYWAHQELSK